MTNPDTPALIVGTNSYISLADANALAASRLFAERWNAATDDTCTRALITATALLDRMRWQGRPVAPTQPLAWPRLPDHCPLGYPLAPKTPREITTASVELAIHLLATGKLPGGAAIQMRQLGDALEMFFPTIADELPKHVRRLIEPYLRASSANVAEVVL